MKQCRHCKETKPNDQFNKATRSSDGLQSWCRECSKQYNNRRNATVKRRFKNGKHETVSVGKGLYSLLTYCADKHGTSVDKFCDSVLREHVRDTILDELVEL